MVRVRFEFACFSFIHIDMIDLLNLFFVGTGSNLFSQSRFFANYLNAIILKTSFWECFYGATE